MIKKLMLATLMATQIQINVQAAHINSQGLGEVLLYPFYTVEGGHQTLVSVVNTTNKTKAVKVRFREAKNAWTVFELNLYMSPWDVWVAALVESDSGGVKLHVPDNSCTIPGKLDGSPFVTTRIDDDVRENQGSRVREGYLEIIEMGEINDARLHAAVVHGADGVPRACPWLIDAWKDGLFDNNAKITQPAGGLHGEAHIVNVQNGKDYSYDAVAISGFSDKPLHTKVGSISPSLADVSPAVSYVFNDDEVVKSSWDKPIDVISALFMHTSVSNTFSRDANVASATDWVLTFPTKHHYVNSGTLTPPFTTIFENNGACEIVNYYPTDREEKRPVAGLSVLRPPHYDFLCWSANVVSLTGDPVLDAQNTVSYSSLERTYFKSGWIDVGFAGNGRKVLVSKEKHIYSGLPSLGFVAQRFKNLNAQPGLIAEYGAVFKNKGHTPFLNSGA